MGLCTLGHVCSPKTAGVTISCLNATLALPRTSGGLVITLTLCEAKQNKKETRMLLPRQKVPDLKLPTLDHGTFDLGKDNAEKGTVVCFYRGLHCPLCATYLAELEKLTPEFEKRGVKTFALSVDGEERARLMADKIKASTLRIGYDLSLAASRDWGLYISTSRGKTSIDIEEPALFSEPGLFMITPAQTLYYGAVQTMPFVRPHFSDLLAAVDGAIAKNYPARGEYTGEV